MTLPARGDRGGNTNELHVQQVLESANGPLTAYQILDRLRSKGISGPPTVYRALNRLIARGAVHRIESLNAYTLCSHPDQSTPVAFAICEECGSVAEFSDSQMIERLRQIAQEIGFGIQSGSIEVRGSCTQCQSAGKERKSTS